MCVENGDLDPADFPSMKKVRAHHPFNSASHSNNKSPFCIQLHWKKFWLKIKDAQTNGVELTTPAPSSSTPAPAPIAAALAPASTTVASPTNKFVGMYDPRDGTKNLSVASPIHGLFAAPEVDLATALGQVKSQCLAKQLPYPPEFEHLGGNVYAAKQFVEKHWHRLSSLYGHRGMTKTHRVETGYS